MTEGTVESLQPYGAFINLGNGLSGLVHISQISEKRIKHPSAVLAVGDKVKEMYRALIKYKKFTFNKLFSVKKHSKKEIVTAFSGLLELSRRNKVITEQDELFGDIEVEKNKIKNV